MIVENKVYFIVVIYKAKLEHLKAIIKLLHKGQVVTVDNSGVAKQSDVGGATLLSQPSNIGYGAAANVGIRYALSKGATWCVVLNQDTYFTKAALTQFTRQLSALKPGIAGPFAGGLDPNRWTTILPSKRADYITGSCIAIHREVVEHVGYFYDPYFLYYEEADYCMRAKSAGFPLTHIPVAGITHEESLSIGRGSPAHQYYLSRNHLLFVERQAPFPVKLYELLRSPKTVVEHVVRKEYGSLDGIRDYLFRRFGSKPGGVA